MKLIDLCSGIGGFSLAAKWMGWDTVAFCERDLFCQKVLEKNFPGVPIYDDVFTFPSESFRGGRDTILSAGFPCQPFSQAGKQLGRDDERHIFPQILRIVETIRPSICVFENVRGLLSIESGRIFAEVITSLEGQGYEVITFCIPASALNAPHRRDRLWIVAHANSDRTMGERRNRYDSNVQRDSATEIQEWQDEQFGVEFTDRTSKLTADTKHTSRLRGQGHNPKTYSEYGDIDKSNSDTECTRLEREGVRGAKLAECDRDAPNARCEYGQSGRDDKMATDTSKRSHSESDTERCGGTSEDTTEAFGVPSNSKGSGQQSSVDRPRQIQYGRTSESTSQWNLDWRDVATATCVRGVDDGSAVNLDGFKLSASKHRENRLKALGNAIVPQIAYELFKAIQTSKPQG